MLERFLSNWFKTDRPNTPAQDSAIATPGCLFSALKELILTHGLNAYWPACRDKVHGGYLTDLDYRWRPDGPQHKSLEYQARQTRAFAGASLAFPGNGYEEAAKQGFLFLTERMWDAVNTGFFALVDRRGDPLENGRKHPHGHLYALEAFVGLSEIIGEDIAREWAIRTFDWLENTAWDKKYGGYWGYYDRGNTRIGDLSFSRNGPIDWIGTPCGLKDLNVFGDSLEALNTLNSRGWIENSKSRLDWHVNHFFDVVYRNHIYPEFFFTRDWMPVPHIPRCGEAFQLLSALIKARCSSRWSAPEYAVCKKIFDDGRNWFAHKNGGYVFARDLNRWGTRGVKFEIPEQVWWVQIEALRCGLLFSSIDPASKEFELFNRQLLRFIVSNFIDSGTSGFRERASNAGFRDKAPKAHIWKDVSHEARLLTDVVRHTKADSGSVAHAPIRVGHTIG